MLLKIFAISLLLAVQLFDQSTAEVNTFIINGTEAKIEEFPWQISLQFNELHNCGGVLLNSRWIMTAAYCAITPRFTESNHIVIGTNDLSDYYNNPSTGLKIERFIINSDYKGNDNDIALIKLSKPVKINNKSIKPACLLNENGNPRPYENLIVTGFGDTYYSRANEILQKSKNLKDYSFDKNGQIKNANLIFTKGEGTAACYGDSGGPVHYTDSMNKKYVVGILSKGDALCRGKNIMTRVSYFLKWIRESIDGKLCIKNLDNL